MRLFIDILKRHLLINNVFSNILTDVLDSSFATQDISGVFLIDDVGSNLVDGAGHFLFAI